MFSKISRNKVFLAEIRACILQLSSPYAEAIKSRNKSFKHLGRIQRSQTGDVTAVHSRLHQLVKYQTHWGSFKCTWKSWQPTWFNHSSRFSPGVSHYYFAHHKCYCFSLEISSSFIPYQTKSITRYTSCWAESDDSAGYSTYSTEVETNLPLSLWWVNFTPHPYTVLYVILRTTTLNLILNNPAWSCFIFSTLQYSFKHIYS